MPNKKIIVTEQDHNKRLDVFIAEKLETTRSQVEKLFRGQQIKLNGLPPKKAGEQVKTGNEITIATTVQTPRSAKSGSVPSATVKAKKIEDFAITIVGETPDYVVINKPSGLLVHPTQAMEKNTLVQWLTKKYPKIKTVGDDPSVRPGIVHRLDKEASGLMVVAKTQAMFELLKEQFKTRLIEKEYLALAHGRIAKDWDEINFPIARGENTERMAARPLAKAKYVSTLAVKPEIPEDDDEMAPGEKDARTEFFVEKRFVNFTLLRVIIHTGRMHQIRAHLLAYNAPLVGDPLYFQKKQKRNWDEKCGRLFLHSAKLSFTDLSGEKQTFESTLPPELEKFLTTLA